MSYDHLIEDSFKSLVLARIVAHLMGDGCVTKRYFAYTNQDSFLLSNFEKDIISLFGKIHITKSKTNSNTFIYMIQNREILNFLNQLFPNYRSHFIEIPKFVKPSPPLQKEFLKAFFDDEGSVGLRVFRKTGEIKRNLTLSSNSFNFIKQVKKILKINFGILSNKILTCKKKIENKQYTNYILSITGKENFVKFRDKIGFSSPNKNHKLNSLISSYIRK